MLSVKMYQTLNNDSCILANREDPDLMVVYGPLVYILTKMPGKMR